MVLADIQRCTNSSAMSVRFPDEVFNEMWKEPIHKDGQYLPPYISHPLFAPDIMQ